MNEELEIKLLYKKIKPTSMRLLVLKNIDATHQCPSDYPNLKIHLSTLIGRHYTVPSKHLKKNNLVHRIDDGTAVPKYALCLEGCKCSPEDSACPFSLLYL